MERSEIVLGRDGQTRGAWDAFSITILASAIVVLVVTLFPSLDLVIARQFYAGSGHFYGEGNLLAYRLRNAFIMIYLAACAVCLAGLVITRGRVRSFLSLGFTKWLLLALCVSIGPGVVANLALKDQLGRARPRDVVEFGGTRSFSAAMVPSTECGRNCSFVCGESSSIFALFFAGACLSRRRSQAFIAGGIAMGSAAGLVRMSQGAHFFSDVVFSGVFMALSVLALWWLFDVIAKATRAEDAAGAPDEAADVMSFARHEVAAE